MWLVRPSYSRLLIHYSETDFSSHSKQTLSPWFTSRLEYQTIQPFDIFRPNKYCTSRFSDYHCRSLWCKAVNKLTVQEIYCGMLQMVYRPKVAKKSTRDILRSFVDIWKYFFFFYVTDFWWSYVTIFLSVTCVYYISVTIFSFSPSHSSSSHFGV